MHSKVTILVIAGAILLCVGYGIGVRSATIHATERQHYLALSFEDHALRSASVVALDEKSGYVIDGDTVEFHTQSGKSIDQPLRPFAVAWKRRAFHDDLQPVGPYSLIVTDERPSRETIIVRNGQIISIEMITRFVARK